MVVRARSFLQSHELFIAARGGGVVGVEEKLAAGVVGIWVGGEGAVDDDDGVDAAVPPVGEHLVGLGADGGGRGVVGDPLTFEQGVLKMWVGLEVRPMTTKVVGLPR